MKTSRIVAGLSSVLVFGSLGYAQEALVSAYQAASLGAQNVGREVRQRVERRRRLPPARVPRLREFRLECGGVFGDYWKLVPDTNPPGSGLLIWVEQGDRVVLDLTKLPSRGPRDRGCSMFNIPQLDAVVDGRPSRGVRLWFNSWGWEQHKIEFLASRPAIYWIDTWPRGRIVVSEKRRPSPRR